MSLIFRTFARNLAGSLRKNVSKPLDSVPDAEVPTQAPLTPELTPEWMAKRHVVIEALPNKLKIGAKALFSKYKSSDIREWGYKLSQVYTEIHGVEKPRDITKLQPFSTSIEILEKKTESGHKQGFYKLPSVLAPEDVSGADMPYIKSEALEHKFEYQLEHAVGYAYKRMPSTYACYYRILNEIKYRIPDFHPRSCLDYGAGTGSGSWAACEIYPDIQAFAVEPSNQMRTVGKKLSAKQPNIRWAENLANLPSIVDKNGVYDIVMCGYVLGEIENAVTRNLILDAMWQRTSNVMVFVEPGTPKGFRLIYSIREWALKTMNRDEANIIAPCPHEGDCPLASHPKSWCHFSQFTAKYPADVISRVKGEYNFENEKYTYIAIGRGPNPRYLDTSPANIAQKSFFWPRLVRPTIKRDKHIIFDVCRVSKLERIVVSKRKTQPSIYKYIRKANWGDLWPYGNTLKEKKSKSDIK
jgi:ribosomal protein RSM22 (predicted rRNA methylase)